MVTFCCRLSGVPDDVDHDRMVDDEVDGHQRVHLLGIAVEQGDAVAHGGEVDDGGNAGEVLHEDAGGLEGDLAGRGAGGEPGGDVLGVADAVGAVVLEAQDVLEQDLEADGQARHVAQMRFGLWDGEVMVGAAFDLERVARAERVVAD